MAVPHPLPDELVELVAERFRLLGEPTRIRLLDLLRDGEATVGQIAERLGTTQQNVSKHIGMLSRAGLVAREKDGNSVRCRIADESVFALCELVCGGLSRQASDVQALVGGGAAS